MPSLRDLAQLRALLPYAAKLLPLLTGAAMPPELGNLNRHFGEIQTESRSLRSEVAGQSEQIAQLSGQINARLDHLAANQESAVREQAALAESLRSLATLLKGVSVAVVILLLAVAVMCGLLLARAA